MTIYSKDESLGSLTREEIASYLESLGDISTGDKLIGPSAVGQGVSSLWGAAPYLGTDTIIGFIDAEDQDSGRIIPVTAIDPDKNLHDKSIKVTFDRFHVREYPGFGEHRILCEFAGKNQVSGQTEDLRFATTCLVRDRQRTSINGLPIFLGLNPGKNGISFEGKTVNIGSSTDDAVLSVLDGDTFKQGLALMDRVQPAIRPLTKLAEGLVRMAAGRFRNKQIHNFSLGLDFEGSPTSARLRCGSYVVVQVGETSNWDWSYFKWEKNSMSITPQGAEISSFDWNYMVFGVSRYNNL